MDEALRVERLQAHLSARDVDHVLADAAPLTAVAEPTSEGYIFDNPLDEMSMYKLYDFFNVPFADRATPEVNTLMGKLVEWAVEKGATQYFDIVSKIREVQQVTGLNSLKSVYHWTTLDTQSRAIDNEMRSLYG